MRLILIGLALMTMASCGGGKSTPTKVVECTKDAQCTNPKANICGAGGMCGCVYRADGSCSSADDCGCGWDCTGGFCAAKKSENCPPGAAKEGEACENSNQGSNCCLDLDCVPVKNPVAGPSGDGADAGICTARS